MIKLQKCLRERTNLTCKHLEDTNSKKASQMIAKRTLSAIIIENNVQPGIPVEGECECKFQKPMPDLTKDLTNEELT
jgi:hypothetical protein